MTTNNGTADHGTTHRQIDAGIMDPSTDGDLLRHHILDFRQMTQFAEAPWIFDQADGVRLRDTDGHWYIDGLSGVFVASLGYGNTKVIEAIEISDRFLVALHRPKLDQWIEVALARPEVIAQSRAEYIQPCHPVPAAEDSIEFRLA